MNVDPPPKNKNDKDTAAAAVAAAKDDNDDCQTCPESDQCTNKNKNNNEGCQNPPNKKQRGMIRDMEDIVPEQPPLRSHSWFAGTTKDNFYHRSWMQNQGHPPEMFDGRPVIAIVNTWSGFTPCNGHLRELAVAVSNGVRENGGFPLEVPVFSTGESCLRPTAMMYRNLSSMDVEELRANPIDGYVLLVGCDKTTPACLMGAASTNLPTIVVSGGPMLNGYHKGTKIGSGTSLWKMHADYKSGVISEAEFLQAEAATSRSTGSCNTMGTASTMACLVEALGMALSGNAAIPAVDSRRKVLAYNSGKRIVDLIKQNITPSQIMTRNAFENAIKVLAAIGGSTNAVIHLLAIAGRVGVPLHLNDFDILCRNIPTIVNLMPAGEHLMEEFYYAGGLPVVIKALIDAGETIGFHSDELTVTGHSHNTNVQQEGVENYNFNVIYPLDQPLTNVPHIAVLYGNLAPNGAVIKLSAATSALLQHVGKAVVFENIDDYKQRIDSEDLDVDKNSIMVLKNCGLHGYPGMAEVGNMALPNKVLREGVRDMVRISDARMSGTAFGTVILHVSPEAAIGGPLALVQTGDEIIVDITNRKLTWNVTDSEMQQRKEQWNLQQQQQQQQQATTSDNQKAAGGGYESLFRKHVEGPELGADFDFLKGCRGAPVPRDSH